MTDDFDKLFNDAANEAEGAPTGFKVNDLEIEEEFNQHKDLREEIDNKVARYRAELEHEAAKHYHKGMRKLGERFPDEIKNVTGEDGQAKVDVREDGVYISKMTEKDYREKAKQDMARKVGATGMDEQEKPKLNIAGKPIYEDPLPQQKLTAKDPYTQVEREMINEIESLDEEGHLIDIDWTDMSLSEIRLIRDRLVLAKKKELKAKEKNKDKET